MELVFQEDWTGPDGQGWPSGWFGVEVFGATTRTIQNNMGQQTAEGDFYYRYDVATFDTVRDIDVTVVFDTMDISTPGSLPGLLARWNEPDDGYYVEIDAQEGGGGSMSVYSAPSYNTVVSGAANLTFLSNTRYLVRLFMEGEVIRLKVWEEGTSEPGTWYIDTTDSNWNTSGWVGVAMYSTDGPREVRWDDFTVLAFIPDEVYQPSVEIITETIVEFDTEILTQPDVEIVSSTTVEYTAPASSGGQPVLVITMSTLVEYDGVVIFTDMEGDSEIFFTTEGELSLEVTPVPVPVTVSQEDIDIVSVTMPVPTEFDQFGRPM